MEKKLVVGYSSPTSPEMRERVKMSPVLSQPDGPDALG